MRGLSAAILVMASTASFALAQERQVGVPLEFRPLERVYFVEVTFNEELGPVDFMLDTGASISVVKYALIEALRAEPVGTEVTYAFNGAEVPLIKYRIPRLELGECGLTEVHVLSAPTLPENVLGLDVLIRLMPFTVGMNELTFQCPDQEVPAG